MAVLDHIDETVALSIGELAEREGCSEGEIRRELEELMDEGEITSTPGWKYRKSRRASTECDR